MGFDGRKLSRVDLRRGVTSFLPPGRKCACLYAVIVRDHPDVVKVGRTHNWASRRREYDTWNLRHSGGIERASIFEINEEWVDLNDLEAEVLDRMEWPRRFGCEWFTADFEDVCRLIDRVLCQGEVVYTLFEEFA